MQKLRMALMAGATLVAATAGAGAQMRSTANIPAGYQPPNGMCRVWFNGVAPARQPAPTDCATARARLTSNSFLVYGGQGQTQQGNGGPWGSRAGGNTDQGGWNNGRTDGRSDRMTDKQRREWEKSRRKAEKEREKEWKKAHKHGDRDDDHDRDRDRDHRDGRNRNDADNRQRQTPQTGQGGVWNNRPSQTGTRVP